MVTSLVDEASETFLALSLTGSIFINKLQLKYMSRAGGVAQWLSVCLVFEWHTME